MSLHKNIWCQCQTKETRSSLKHVGLGKTLLPKLSLLLLRVLFGVNGRLINILFKGIFK
jgi:hypothetical protein